MHLFLVTNTMKRLVRTLVEMSIVTKSYRKLKDFSEFKHYQDKQIRSDQLILKMQYALETATFRRAKLC